MARDHQLDSLARKLHEARIAFCWGSPQPHRYPWPDKLPGDFGYEPVPWVDIAYAQAKSIMSGSET